MLIDMLIFATLAFFYKPLAPENGDGSGEKKPVQGQENIAFEDFN